MAKQYTILFRHLFFFFLNELKYGEVHKSPHLFGFCFIFFKVNFLSLPNLWMKNERRVHTLILSPSHASGQALHRKLDPKNNET